MKQLAMMFCPELANEHWQINWTTQDGSALASFETEVKSRDWEPQFAPDMPLVRDGFSFIRQPYRVLRQWAPKDSGDEYEGRYVVVIDTMALRKAAR